MIKKTLIGVLTLTAILFVLGTVAASDEAIGDRETILPPVPNSRFETDQYGWSYGEIYIEEITQPYLKRLDKFKHKGTVVDNELLFKESAIHVSVEDSQDLKALEELQVEGEVNPVNTYKSNCEEAVVKSDRVFPTRSIIFNNAPNHVQATNPRISIVMRGDYAYVAGGSDPNTQVAIVIRDSSGEIIASGTVTSDDSGRFFFRPNSQGCGESAWVIGPGDVVEVTAAGNTSSTVVAPISASVDPNTDTITGHTIPNRSIELVIDPTDSDCDDEPQFKTISSDDNGGYNSPLIGGFDRSGWVVVIVLDANGNDTQSYFWPPHIVIDYDGEISGHVEPEVEYSLSLKRGNKIIGTLNGTTDKFGYFEDEFAETLQSGDVIQASGDGTEVSTIYAEVTKLFVDYESQIITGTVESEGNGRLVRVSPCRSDELDCEEPCGCAVGSVGMDGNFILDYTESGFTLIRSDTDFSPGLYDGEGNTQLLSGRITVPYLEITPYDDSVRGYWGETGAVVTMTLRDSEGVVKGTDSDTIGDSNSYSTSFFGYLNSQVKPGDRIDASDGSYTMTVSSVPNVTAYLDANDDTVSGSAPGEGSLVGDLVEYYYQFGGSSGRRHYCNTGTYSGGSYTVNFGSQSDVKANFETYVYYPETNGHIITVYSHAFAMNAEKNGNHVYGFTPIHEIDVGIELWRDGAVKTTMTTTSESDGSFSIDLIDTVPMTITQSDTVRIDPEGMTAYELEIPELTVHEEPNQNRVSGRAPAHSTLQVYLDQPSTHDYWWDLTTADADGDYFLDFDGIFNNDCLEAQVGACTQPETVYFNDEGHTVYIWGSEPGPVSADVYESDDIYLSASTYTNLQSHTFHTYDDVDWVSLAVGDDDVGVIYYFLTENLGINANTNLYLYDTDGFTELASDTSYSSDSSEIAWTAISPGTYFVKIVPESTLNTVDCGSTYDFIIERNRIFLPNIVR